MRLERRQTQRQKILQMNVAGKIAVAALLFGISLFIYETTRPDLAYADVCENAYVLDWADSTTWDVDCGEVNAANWNVKGLTCTYWSPVFTASGSPGDAERELDINVRINQSGNLGNDDTAWVYLYVNDKIDQTYICPGDSVSKVFIVTRTIAVPAGGTYYVSITMRNNKANELWQIKNGDVTTCLRAPDVLPVTLVDFRGKARPDNTIFLEWLTQTELNNAYFTVERSKDGEQFEELARIEGFGTTMVPQVYEYIDTSPFSGNNLYRLKQTDYDGKTAIFKTIVVRSQGGAAADPQLKVFPNPFSTVINLELDNPTDSRLTAQLLSSSGNIILREELIAYEGLNNFRLNLPGEAAEGVYFLQLTDDTKVIATEKLVCRR